MYQRNPGMIAHGLVEFTFSIWIFVDHGTVVRLLESSVLETGVDSVFVVVAGLSAFSGAATVVALRRAGRPAEAITVSSPVRGSGHQNNSE